MKYPLYILALLYPLMAMANEPRATDEVVLRGVFDMGTRKMYSLSSPGGARSGWVKPGETFLGYTIVKYDPETQILTLDKKGESYAVGLAGASAAPLPDDNPEARLAEAKKIFQAMKFKETVGEAIDAQMKAVMDMQRQQLAQSGSPLAEDGEYMDFMETAMRQMMQDIDWETIQTSMERVYAETFTEAELKGITEFYSTPSGQAMIEKNTELQQKSMQAMMPAIMEASQKMGQSVQEFMMERSQKESDKSATASE